MKKAAWLLLIWGGAMIALDASGQGQMAAGLGTVDFGARTRVGTLDGPPADGNYLGQMLVGDLPESLTPMGPTMRHVNGLAFGPVFSVPDHPGFTFVHVQFAAWDERLWGSSIEGVPPDQLGLTDIVLHELAHPNFGFPPMLAIFHQSAIVPIPEPSVLALVIMGVVLGGLRWRGARRARGYEALLQSAGCPGGCSTQGFVPV